MTNGQTSKYTHQPFLRRLGTPLIPSYLPARMAPCASIQPHSSLPNNPSKLYETVASMARATLTDKERTWEGIDAEILSLEFRIIQLKRKRNELNPASSLPAEILSTIIRLCTWGRGLRHLKSLARITAVCAYWRDVATGDSSLYTSIDASIGPEWLDIFAERSRSMPISVQLHASRFFMRTVATPTLIRLSSLLAQTSRLVSVIIGGYPATIERLAASLGSCAPLLESLKVYVFHSNPDEHLESSLDLGHSFRLLNTPILKDVSFTNCAPPWSSPVYHNTTSLDLTFNQCNAPFTPKELAEGLKTLAHSLQDLRLCFIIDEDEVQSIDVAVALPKLQNLFLGRTIEEAINLLPFLQLPASACLDLQCAWAAVEDMEAIGMALSTSWLSVPLSRTSPPVMESLCIQSHDLELHLVGWRHYSGGAPKAQNLVLSSDGESLISGFSFEDHLVIMNHLPLNQLLSLSLACSDITVSGMYSILRQLGLLQTITLCVYSDQLDAFSSLLPQEFCHAAQGGSTPTSQQAAAVTYLPSLQTIIVKDMDEIMADLRALSVALRLRHPFGGRIRSVEVISCGPIDDETALQLKKETGIEEVICL
ncbi:hypothetical protein BKA70DRAFT_552330 [Coprinopsis sp. MPI-PUGE-AT-0042]|nr:hypothetical protein BKA70DRAFT_552330 [Coprinopsis sp. MPI-PUGE-AT-0042]